MNDEFDPTTGEHPALTQSETRLAAEIKGIAATIQADPLFEAALESRLIEIHQKENRRWRFSDRANSGRIRVGRLIGWGSLTILLLVGLVWVLSNLVPGGGPPAVSPEAGAGTAFPGATKPAGVTDPSATQTATPLPSPTPTTAGEVFALAIQADVDFFLQAKLPDGLPEVNLYQHAAWEPLTLDSARQTAAQIGVQGPVYLSPYGQPEANNFLIWDGFRKATFYGSARSFEYESGNPALYEQPTCQPPCMPAEAAGALERFLNERGLLDFPATTRLSETRSQVVQLVQLLDGIPLLYRPGEYQGEALVSSDGEILRLNYNPSQVVALGKFPILTAEQAWKAATSMQPTIRIALSSHHTAASDLQTWRRAYPLDQPVEIFGNLQVFESAEGGAPLVTFNDYEVTGNTQGLTEAAVSNPFVQVWGQFSERTAGGRLLQVEGWQRSAFPGQTLAGTIRRQENQGFLDADGQSYLLPDLPANVPEGRTLTASGVVIEQPQLTLAWTMISTDFGGGGGGGGSGFAELNLAGDSVAAPPAAPTGIPAEVTEQRLEGAEGRPMVFITQFEDGSATVEVLLHFGADSSGSMLTPAYLDGPGLAGIEAFHNQPVKVWGIYREIPGEQPRMTVERIEPVYPGLTMQTWLGRYELIDLEGTQSMLFTAQDGEQYVLEQANTTSFNQSEFGVGDPVIIEGYVIPDKQSAGGYPVIDTLLMNPGQGLDDLSSYAAQSLTPLIRQESGTAGERQNATITAVELAYYTEDMRFFVLPAGAQQPYIQPVWRFTGTYENGSAFEILIQALEPRYLVQP